MEHRQGGAGPEVPECACREKDAVISTLEREVAQQRELRAREALRVETKALRIKEWVAHKLRELELQNVHLQEQNQKCNEQLELLKNRLLQLSQLSLVAPSRHASAGPSDEDEAPPAYAAVNFSLNRSPVPGPHDPNEGPPRHPPGVRLERKRFREDLALLVSSTASEDPPETEGGATFTPTTRVQHPPAAFVQSSTGSDVPGDGNSTVSYGCPDQKLDLGGARGPRTRAAVSTEDDLHDYAEIYTPSKELADSSLGGDPTGRPPTPPLHRFPSWESRIYEVALNGIVGSLNPLPSATAGGNNLSTVDGRAHGTFVELNVPVYAAVKGRASQIRSVPFTGESSDSSDNEDNTRATVDTESTLSAYSPRDTSSPIKYRDTSAESMLSDDYAVPPDAVSTDGLSTDSVDQFPARLPGDAVTRKESLEKSGYLTKLGGKLKTWKRRWFVLKNGALRYYKSQSDINRKPQGHIALDEVCRVTRAEGSATFEIATNKRSFYLTADSSSAMEEWVKVLQNVLRKNATRLLLSGEDHKPAIEGWLNKVKHGHSRRCWCVLIGRVFLYFKAASDTTPLGQINLRDAHVEEVVHVSDSDEEEEGGEVSRSEYTVGIFPPHQSPTYLLMPNKQELDTWLYHLTVVSSGENAVGTQYEQLISRLMEVDGDENSVMWKHPLLVYSKESISQPLTTLPSDALRSESVKMFKSIQLFVSVPLDASGIDYHVVLAQNALAQCLGLPELQNELVCQLIKQTSRHSQQKVGVQQLLLCATQSLFLCDSTEKGSPTSSCPPNEGPCPSVGDSKLNPPQFVFIQGWQLLALAVSLFVPRKRTLWYLRKHLRRNADPRTEPGKYAIFCRRALERALANGERECKPSRMEVLSILLKNPFHHSNPHSIPVHFLNGTYQVVGFDGSATVEEFVRTLNTEAGIRDASQSGFALYGDDPVDKSVEHCLDYNAKLCDVISRWEQALREKQLGKFESTRVIKLTYKNRLCFRQLLKAETDKERLLTAYHVNEEVVQGKFPLTKNLSLELAALMAQIEFGDYNGERIRGSGTPKLNPLQQLQQILERFFPRQFVEPSREKSTMEAIRDKWETLKGRSIQDCVRIYLNCVRKWSFCGATLFAAKLKTKDPDQQMLWLAVTEDGISLLDCTSMHPWTSYPYSCVMTFGGCRDDFMLVVCPHEAGTERLLFAMPKPKILELTLLIADYMNALRTAVPASTSTAVDSVRARVRATDAASVSDRSTSSSPVAYSNRHPTAAHEFSSPGS